MIIAHQRPSAWICTSSTEAFVTQDADKVREFMDGDRTWTVTPLYTRSSLPMPEAARELAKKHDWCPTCGRGWSGFEERPVFGKSFPETGKEIPEPATDAARSENASCPSLGVSEGAGQP